MGWRGGRLGAAALALGLLMLCAVPAGAQEVRYLRVGTGPPGETHFPMGGLIAGALSNPPGSRPCDRGGSCGVPGVIAAASITNGSAANAEAIGAGRLDLALVQADIAMWAYQGAAPFDGRPVNSLRGIAQLYPDEVHVVTRRDAGLTSIRDLRGKRVSLGENGSGTLVHARQVLAAWGLRESDVKAEYLRSALAADAMAAGKLDAFVVLDGSPVPSVAELAKVLPIALLPVTGTAADKLRRGDRLLVATEIPAGTYEGVDTAVPTLSVGVGLAVSADLSDDLVYAICKALWQPATTTMLAESQPRGALVQLPNALTGLGVPLHPGAARFYGDQGMIK